MVQRVQDEDGSIHEFPDDASPQEINSIFAEKDKQKNLDMIGGTVTNPGISNDISGGMLSGVVGAGKLFSSLADVGNYLLNPSSAISSLVTNKALQKTYPENNEMNSQEFDPYKAMGTTDKPWYTPGGILQTAAGLIAPGAGAAKAIPEISPTAVSLGKELVDAVSPGRVTKNLLEEMGKGDSNTEEATKSIVSDIQNSHNEKEAQATAHLNYPLQQAGQENIYQHVDPLISTNMDKAKSMINSVKDLNVGDLYDTFKNNPNFQNAHNLQSELGVLMGDIMKIPGKTNAERLQLQSIKSVRDQLKSDIGDFLEKRDANSNEVLSPQYKTGSDLYRDNVAPYLSSPKLRQIVREGRTTVPNVHSIFQSPYDLVDRLSGESKIGPVNKILSDLPQETKDKILFRKIGAMTNADNPEKIISSLNSADQNGYSSLMSQDIKNKLLGIKSGIRNQKILKYSGGTLVSAAGLGTALDIAHKLYGK